MIKVSFLLNSKKKKLPGPDEFLKYSRIFYFQSLPIVTFLGELRIGSRRFKADGFSPSAKKVFQFDGK